MALLDAFRSHDPLDLRIYDLINTIIQIYDDAMRCCYKICSSTIIKFRIYINNMYEKLWPCRSECVNIEHNSTCRVCVMKVMQVNETKLNEQKLKEDLNARK